MKFLHSMIRVKNEVESIRFYCDLLGLKKGKRIRLEDCYLQYLIDEDTNSFIDLLCVPKPLSVQPLLQRWAKATTSSPKSLWQSVLHLTARWTILWRLCRSNKTVHDVLKQKGFSEKYELY